MLTVKKDGILVEFKSICIIEFGDKIWYNDKGQKHREDGPAIEHENESKEWWLNGKRHREDGPAIEYSNGAKEWWFNNKRHREDGPAIEYASGLNAWWLNDKKYTELEFVQKQMSETVSKFGYKFDIKDGNIVLIKE